MKREPKLESPKPTSEVPVLVYPRDEAIVTYAEQARQLGYLTLDQVRRTELFNRVLDQ